MFLLAAPAALVAVIQLGRIHPDEVYQVLEPAYFKVHGYGILAWEWRVGLRSWAVPLFFAAWLKACAALGIDHPRIYRAVLEVPQLLLHAWALAAVFRYARRRTDERGALIATALVALYGLTLMFAGRTMSESFSASFLLVAFEALDRAPERAWRTGLLAGAALGLATVARYGSAVFVGAALGYVAACRRWRVLGGMAAAGGAVLLALAALDWATWGRPLHSLLLYADFNVLTDQAAQRFGASPPSFYLWPVFGLTPLWAWPGLAQAVRTGRWRENAPAVAAGIYLLVVALTPHKETRFVYPAQQLLLMAAAPGLAVLLMKLGPRSRWPLVGASLAAGLAVLLWLPPDMREVRGQQFRSIVKATRGADATGLLIIGEGIWGAGGFFYIGKNIPWAVADWPHDHNFQAAMRDPRVNRAVLIDGRALAEIQQFGFRVIGTDERETILAR
jgi:4-amino-4-deoxy-L-arabinose transferase-like glycosyltransferase